MKRSTTYLVLAAASVLVCVIGFAGPTFVQADEQTASSSESDQAVQERAVPRMAVPKGQLKPVNPPRPTKPGLVQEGNKLVAQPGYVLEQGPDNKVTARIAGGGTTGGLGITTLSCRCVTSDGNFTDGTCSTAVIGNDATCSKGASGTCTARCAWASQTTGLSRFGVIR